MKRIFLLFSVALSVGLVACHSGDKPETTRKDLLPTSLVANPASANGTDTALAKTLPTMDFTDTMHNFGTIQQGENVEHDFSFKNNGNGPLLIISAIGSCGCTVPEFPHDPVPPGGTGIMKVTFHTAGKFGEQEKMVTISSNARRGMEHLFIQAVVNVPKN